MINYVISDQGSKSFTMKIEFVINMMFFSFMMPSCMPCFKTSQANDGVYNRIWGRYLAVAWDLVLINIYRSSHCFQILSRTMKTKYLKLNTRTESLGGTFKHVSQKDRSLHDSSPIFRVKTKHRLKPPYGWWDKNPTAALTVHMKIIIIIIIIIINNNNNNNNNNNASNKMNWQLHVCNSETNISNNSINQSIIFPESLGHRFWNAWSTWSNSTSCPFSRCSLWKCISWHKSPLSPCQREDDVRYLPCIHTQQGTVRSDFHGRLGTWLNWRPLVSLLLSYLASLIFRTLVS